MASSPSYERAPDRKGIKSYTTSFFLAAINFFLIILIIDVPAIQNISRWVVGISLFFMVANQLKNRITAKTKQREDPRDLLSLMGKYLKINRRHMLASILGLILAITIISQIVLLTSSTTGEGYENALGNTQVPMLTVENNIHSGTPYKNTILNHSEELTNRFIQETRDAGITPTTTSIGLEYELMLKVNPEDTDYRSHHSYRTVGITEAELEALKSFPTFPSGVSYSHDMVLLILTRWDYAENPSYYNQLIAKHQVEFKTGTSEMSDRVNLTVDAVWSITEQDYDFAYANGYDYLSNRVERSIVLPVEKESDLIGSKVDIDPDRIYFYGFVDLKSIKSYDIDELLTKLRSVRRNVEAFVYSLSLDAWVESRMENEIRWQQEDAAAIASVLLLVSVPMLGISLYLVYFSLNLVETRKRKLVAIMKIRGVSSNQLKFMMTAEALIASIFAIAVGMTISVPVTQVVLDSSNIFGGATSVLVTPDWFWRIPVIGLILAIDLNIGSILSISSQLVEEGEDPEETNEPFWKRFYLDIIFTIVGVASWLVIRYISFPNQNLYYFVLYAVGPFALFALIVGLPLFVSRYYSGFLTSVSDLLWIRAGNMIALATRNMRKNKFSASKLTVLLMLGMLFGFVAIAVPHSFGLWAYDQAYYETGADLAITNIDVTNSTLMAPLSHEAVKGHTEVKQTKEDFFSIDTFNQITFIGIDPTNFADVAFWDRSYADRSLHELTATLEDNKILLQEDAMRVLDLEVGDSWLQELGDATLNEEVAGSFKYWPRFISSISSGEYYINKVYVIMNLNMFSSYFDDVPSRVYVDVSDAANEVEVFKDLQTEYDQLAGPGDPLAITSAAVVAATFFELDEVNLLLAMFDTLLIVTIAASIIGIGYFSFITLSERKKEIGVFRALGMISKQIFLLLIVESLIMVITAFIMGILFGIFVSSNLFILLGADFGGLPPMKLRYPMLETILFTIGTFAATTLAAAIPARSTANKQTGSILRAE